MAEKNIWDKFEEMIDTKALVEDVKEIQKNGQSFKEVPYGEYEVKIEKMDLVESKSSKNPMLTIWFKIVNGEYKNSIIFMNQVVTHGMGIHAACEILRSMDTGHDIQFSTYPQFGNLIMDVMEAVDGNLEFALKYGEGKKGFNSYEIIEVFEVE